MVDFISALPADWIIELATRETHISSSDERALGLVRSLRLLRLLKLMRVFKISHILDRIDTFMYTPPVVSWFILLTTRICFLAHLIGCIWFYISSVELKGNSCETGKIFCVPDEPSTNWFYELNVVFDWHADVTSEFSKYIVSIYWVFTTITTVGYGEITPTNNLERTFTVAVMVFGATVFGYIITSAAELSSRSSNPNMHLCILQDYCEERALSHRTQRTARQHYEFWCQEMAPHGCEAALLQMLPPPIRKEVILHIHRDIIASLAPFQYHLPDWFVATTVRLLEPQAFPACADVIGPDEVSLLQDIFFVHKGNCEAYRPRVLPRHCSLKQNIASQIEKDEIEVYSEGSEDIIEIYEPGFTFGFELLLQRVRPQLFASKKLTCVRCSSSGPCFLFALRHSVLVTIHGSQSNFSSMLQQVLSEVILDQLEQEQQKS